MTIQKRKALATKTFNKVLAAAIKADMIQKPAAFKLALKVTLTSSDRAWAYTRGSLSPSGNTERLKVAIQLSIHNRDADPLAYRDHLVKLNPGKSNWKRAVEMAKQGKCVYVEYASVQYDSEIGMFTTDGSKPELHLMATAAHELAHAIHGWNWKLSRKNRAALGRPHGIEWQKIYRELRNLTVNKLIAAPKDDTADLAIAARVPTPVRRPKPESICGQVWAIFDQHSKKDRGFMIMASISAGFQPGTSAANYSAWKRFNNQ